MGDGWGEVGDEGERGRERVGRGNEGLRGALVALRRGW